MLINFVDATNDANHYTKPQESQTFGQYHITLLQCMLTGEHGCEQLAHVIT